MKNILQMLEASEKRFPDKTAFSDGETEFSYARLTRSAKGVGTALARLGTGFPFPVPVIAPRSAAQVVGMLGALYGGGFYTVIDPDSPEERVRDIFNTLQPVTAVCAREFLPLARRLLPGKELISLEEASDGEIDEGLLSGIRSRMIDADPAYVL
nr:AMP-binding protein [Clostridiales bacterium]